MSIATTQVSELPPLPFNTGESKILLIEHDDTYRTRLSKGIKQSYPEFQDIKEGEEGWQFFLSHEPDMVILDMHLPEKKAVEISQKLRSHGHGSQIPILAQAEERDFEARAQAFACGLNDLLLKPVSISEVEARIKVHLERHAIAKYLDQVHNQKKQALELASHLQTDLLPTPKIIENCSSRYRIHMSQHYIASSQVDGDIWNVMPIDDNRLAIYMCDFSGHGMQAAMYVMRLNQLIQSSVLKEPAPETILGDLNQSMRKILPSGHFVTLFLAIIDNELDQMTYAGAGSPYPLLLSTKNQEIYRLDSRGVPLGLQADTEYKANQTEFTPGDTLLLYSDALTEHCLERQQLITLEWLENWLKHHGLKTDTKDKEEHKKLMVSLLGSITPQHPLPDDMTLALCSRY